VEIAPESVTEERELGRHGGRVSSKRRRIATAPKTTSNTSANEGGNNAQGLRVHVITASSSVVEKFLKTVMLTWPPDPEVQK
jgi:hypothetical protein